MPGRLAGLLCHLARDGNLLTARLVLAVHTTASGAFQPPPGRGLSWLASHGGQAGRTVAGRPGKATQLVGEAGRRPAGFRPGHFGQDRHQGRQGLLVGVLGEQQPGQHLTLRGHRGLDLSEEGRHVDHSPPRGLDRVPSYHRVDLAASVRPNVEALGVASRQRQCCVGLCEITLHQIRVMQPEHRVKRLLFDAAELLLL